MECTRLNEIQIKENQSDKNTNTIEMRVKKNNGKENGKMKRKCRLM